MRDAVLTIVVAVAVIAWLGGFVSIIRFQRTYRPWLKPLFERGEVAPFTGGLTWGVLQRLYGDQPEPGEKAELLRLETRRWWTRTMLFSLVFALCFGVLWLVIALTN